MLIKKSPKRREIFLGMWFRLGRLYTEKTMTIFFPRDKPGVGRRGMRQSDRDVGSTGRTGPEEGDRNEKNHNPRRSKAEKAQKRANTIYFIFSEEKEKKRKEQIVMPSRRRQVCEAHRQKKAWGRSLLLCIKRTPGYGGSRRYTIPRNRPTKCYKVGRLKGNKK